MSSAELRNAIEKLVGTDHERNDFETTSEIMKLIGSSGRSAPLEFVVTSSPRSNPIGSARAHALFDNVDDAFDFIENSGNEFDYRNVTVVVRCVR